MKLRLTASDGWKLLFWAALLGTLALSLASTSVPLPTTGWDKTNHLLAFSVLTVLVRFAYPGRAWPYLLGLLGYGALIEILQSFTRYRSADWTDIAADAVGILLGWGITLILATAWPAGRSQPR
ncbi:VanZ like family protein [Pigmentiphaga humi]|uniref:VanZ like family protein n=1 Tax=Pigmentiphaga humi TaxID=2478468 RepID=A0A3P4B7S1_9BURK|nr:VanZ family protein [Pigmentiphaga humi]VCU71660.1 VanZ like family protein [Pigmentiphaga humi]